MAVIKQIQIGSKVYDLQDADAQSRLANIATNLTWDNASRTFSWTVGGQNYHFTIPEGTAVATSITENGTEPVTSAAIYAGLAAKTDIDEAGRLKQEQSPITYLRKITGEAFDGGEVLNIGDAWLDEDNPGEYIIRYKVTSTSSISLGAPSPDLIYCHTDTKKLYKWDATRGQMIQIAIPTYNSSNFRLIF